VTPAGLPRPLVGRRVAVTRTREQAGTLAEGLRSLGAEVIELPTIEIVPPDSYGPLDEALRSLASYQWLVLTSANAVRAIGERLAVLGIDSSALGSVRIAAVGPSTAAALMALGATAALIPQRYVAESLIEAMRESVRVGDRALIARPSVARDVIPEALVGLGVTVDVVDAYRTVIPEGSVARVRGLFRPDQAKNPGDGLPDTVTFTSSSTVKHFLKLLAEGAIVRPAGLHAISIGPITSATLRECGWEPAAEAIEHDVQGLIAATVRALNSEK
jgi:uroporphyrinogen-III synthase